MMVKKKKEKEMKWSDPQLIILGEAQRSATGDCLLGSGNMIVCSSGSFAGSCMGTGNLPLPPPP